MSISESINLAIVIAIALIFIFIGGTCLYVDRMSPINEKNPIWFSFGVALAGAGGNLLTTIFIGSLLPPVIQDVIRTHKTKWRF